MTVPVDVLPAWFMNVFHLFSEGSEGTPYTTCWQSPGQLTWRPTSTFRTWSGTAAPNTPPPTAQWPRATSSEPSASRWGWRSWPHRPRPALRPGPASSRPSTCWCHPSRWAPGSSSWPSFPRPWRRYTPGFHLLGSLLVLPKRKKHEWLAFCKSSIYLALNNVNYIYLLRSRTLKKQIAAADNWYTVCHRLLYVNS